MDTYLKWKLYATKVVCTVFVKAVQWSCRGKGQHIIEAVALTKSEQVDTGSATIIGPLA